MKNHYNNHLNREEKYSLLLLLENTTTNDKDDTLKDFLSEFEKKYILQDFSIGLKISEDKLNCIKEYSHAYDGLVNNMRSTPNLELDNILQLSEKILAISKKESFTETEKLLIRQWKSSCDAYYHYVTGAYDESMKLTELCIDQVSQLIYIGLNSFFFRLIEQYYNLAKILIKQADISRCISVTNFLLKSVFKGYMLRQGSLNHDIKLRYTDSSVLHFFSIQYLARSIYIHSQLRTTGDIQNSYKIYKHIISGVDFNTCLSQYDILKKWFTLKEYFFNEKYTDFLINFSDFIDLAKEKVWINFKISLIEDLIYIIFQKKGNLNTIKGILKSKIKNSEAIHSYLDDMKNEINIL